MIMDILSDKIVTTRKQHMCNACARVFPKGTTMRRQVNTSSGIVSWYECSTCQILLSKHRSHFEGDGLCYELCVNEALEYDQTPEDLLELFEANK